MSQNNHPPELGQLIQNLKNEDLKYSGLSRSIKYIYWGLIPLYAIVSIGIWLETGDLLEIVRSLSMLIAMGIFALLFAKYQKEYREVDYAQPTTTLLKEAAYRYKPFQARTGWALLALICMSASLSLREFSLFSIIEVQVIFWIALTIAALIGLWVWKVRYKPIRDQALRYLAELEKV